MALYSYCQFCTNLTIWGCHHVGSCTNGNRFEAEITPEMFNKQMIYLKERYGHDPETCHGKMDDLMSQVLSRLGYEHGVKVFEDTDKWYA